MSLMIISSRKLFFFLEDIITCGYLFFVEDTFVIDSLFFFIWLCHGNEKTCPEFSLSSIRIYDSLLRSLCKGAAMNHYSDTKVIFIDNLLNTLQEGNTNCKQN